MQHRDNPSGSPDQSAHQDGNANDKPPQIDENTVIDAEIVEDEVERKPLNTKDQKYISGIRYTKSGVPTFESAAAAIRDRIARAAGPTAVGDIRSDNAECGGLAAPDFELDKRQAEAHKRLEEIRRSLNNDQPKNN